MHRVAHPNDRVSSLLDGADMTSEMAVNLRQNVQQTFFNRNIKPHLLGAVASNQSNTPRLLVRVHN